MLKINSLKKEQLNLLFKYSKMEKWSLEKPHVECQYRNYWDDFFVAYFQNELVGFILAIRHTQTFGFISNFIILKRFRGRGFGRELFSHALKHLGSRQIALDAVKGKEQFYKNFGFKSYFDVNVAKFITGSVTLPSSHVEVVDFNEKRSLANVDAYMQCLITDKSIRYKAVKASNAITSYGLCFAYNDGYKVVLNAEDINEAITLFFECIKDFETGTPIYMQISKLEPLLQTVRKLLNMKTTIHYTRMYNKIID